MRAQKGNSQKPKLWATQSCTPLQIVAEQKNEAMAHAEYVVDNK